jgi:hypothetical protein
MEVQNVEARSTRPNLSEHRKMGRNVPRQLVIEPECDLPAWNELRPGPAIPAREQHHLVSALDQRIAEVSDDSFSTSIEFGGYRLIKGSDLSDAH